MEKIEVFNDPNLNYVEDLDMRHLFIYLQSRFDIKKSGQKLCNDDSKIFYKLRHNCFKSYFLYLLGLPNVAERSFREFGVNSNKTPDFLLLLNQGYLMIEFTVVNKFESALNTKASLMKYNSEVSKLKSLGNDVKDYYAVLSLDHDISGINSIILEISRTFNLAINDDPESVISMLKERFEYINYHVTQLMPELLSNSSYELSNPLKIKCKIKYKDLNFNSFTNLVSIKRLRNQHVLSALWSNISKLEREIKHKRSKGKFKIFCHVKTNTAYIDYHDKGIGKTTLMSLIQGRSLELINWVKISGTFADLEEPFDIFGKGELVGDFHRESVTELIFDTSAYLNQLKKRYNLALLDNKVKLIGNMVLNDQIDKVEDYYSDLLKKKHDNANNKVFQPKDFFILPVSSGIKYGNYIPIKIRSKLEITKSIISRVKEIRFNSKIIVRDIEFDKLNEISKKLTDYQQILDELVDNNTFRKLKNISNIKHLEKFSKELNSNFTPEVRACCLKIVELKGNYSKYLGEETRTSYKNRISLSHNLIKKHWDKEMEHFNQEKGKIKVSSNLEFDEILTKLTFFMEWLFQKRTDSSPDKIYSDTNPVGGKLKKTCIEMSNFLKEKEEDFLKTNLSHNLLMISRVCYSLLYYSNMKANKQDIFYDNCGFENLLLLVKGGKKIISTKRSRLFKLIIPISKEVSFLYKSKFTEIVSDNSGNMFCVFPWRTFKFEMLKKCIELPFSFGNYYISSSIESSLSDSEFQKFCSIKVLNMFSQRRKVEIWFGNLRYIYFNSLGTHTNVLKLISDMVDFDYDPYMFFIQRMFCKNYKNLVKSVREGKIFDLFTNSNFPNFDLCAEKFDESLFMTKAPFDPTNEHLKNLKSVLSLHSEFTESYSSDPLKLLSETECDANSENYIEDLFSDDFKFDPKLCFMVGQFMSDKFSSITTKTDLGSKFAGFLSESYTSIKTSKGMRSDDSKFWGQKGYDVIFSNPKFKNSIMSFLNNPPESSSEFSKNTYQMHQSFSSKITENINDKTKLFFDIKDKDQYKGSREIYVMSENTKLLQQPLERFFKELCRLTPNEIINKKSHIRPKLIHSKVYEYSGNESLTYCTLDCRKWAPKSNLWKYYYFIKGLSQFLPTEFMSYFENFWSMMFYKRVKIQKRFVELLKRNENTINLTECLIEEDTGDYFFTMPYSFMMGIFNYLSSLFHAASQLYFDEVISEPQGVNLKLLAHSDDSGGVIISESYEKNVKMFKIYEMFQKGNNHLFSDKKCSLSEHSFELISIMYNNKRLIPMTHKFLANISFEPKGGGWLQDISTVVSKVVEVYANGGTHIQLYSIMLAMSEMIRKFYHLERLKTQSKVPLALGGVFNMHPIHLVLLGADSQEIMLDYIETEEQRSFRINTFNMICGTYVIGKGGSPNYKIPLHKRHSNLLDLTDDKRELLNIMSLLKTRTTFDDIVMYFSSLYDQNFTFSLTGVDMPKIFTSTLFSKIGVQHFYENKQADLKKLNRLYNAGNLLIEEKIQLNVGSYDFSNYHQYMKASESIYFKFDHFNVRNNKTCKPLIYNTFMNLGLNISFETINEVIAFNRSDYVKKIHKNPRKMEVMIQWINNILPGQGSQKLEILKSLQRKDLEKVRSAYMFFPSQITIDTIERFWTYSLLYTTRRYYISSAQPQFFTIENFTGWSSMYENLKHYYLLVKLMNEIDLTYENVERIKNHANCNKCIDREGMVNMVKEYYKIKQLKSFDEMTTNLAFVTYIEPQKRSINIWYGPTDFELHTQFGSIEHIVNQGTPTTHWKVENEAYLSEMWHLYQTFCKTRGILYEIPNYSNNYTSDLKIGFNDLDTPYFIGSYFTGMFIQNSKVSIVDVPTRLLRHQNGKITYLDKNCDFEIYYNYDINQGFYQEHNLKDISDLMFEKEFVMEVEDIINNFGSSKTYKLLQNDESHSSYANFNKKYENDGFLGSHCSLSRALAISDQLGETRYKTSINPTPLEHGIFNFQTIRDVPVLDLFEACSFARVSHLEQKTLSKIANEEDINENDRVIVNQIKEKMGLESVGIALTLFRDVFRNLSGKDLVKVDPKKILEVLLTLIESISVSMEIQPKTTSASQIQFRRDIFWNNLYFLLKNNGELTSISNLLTLGLNRSQNDNARLSWEVRRTNVFTSVMNFSQKTLSNCQKFIHSALSHLKLRKRDFYNDLINQVLTQNRHIVIASRKDYSGHLEAMLPNQKFIPEALEEEISYEHAGCFMFEELEFADCMNYGGIPEDYIDRDYLGDEIEFYCITKKDILQAQEETVWQDFSNIKIKTLGRFLQFPWLGPCEYYFETVGNLTFHVTEFPGKRNIPVDLWNNKLFKYIEKDRLTTKELKAVEELPDVDEEKLSKWDKQASRLKKAGFDKPKNLVRYINHQIKPPKTFEELIENIDLEISSKMDVKRKRNSMVNYLPGFSGILQDNLVKSELETIFVEHSEIILSGQAKLNRNTYDHIILSIKKMYKSANDDHKAALIFLLSMLKDCIIDRNSDSWFVDGIFTVLNHISNYTPEENDADVYIPPAPKTGTIKRRIRNPYEDLE